MQIRLTRFQKHFLGLHHQPLSLEEIKLQKSHVPYRIVFRDAVRNPQYKIHTQLVDLDYERGIDCIVANEENGFYVVGPHESVIFIGSDSEPNGLCQSSMLIRLSWIFF